MSGAGRDELRLASEHDRRAERARADFAAAAAAWWNARYMDRPEAETIGELYQAHIDHDRTRAQLADALGQLQRLHVLMAEMMAAQAECNVFDHATKPEKGNER